MKDTIGRRGMFSLRNFGSPTYSRCVLRFSVSLASEIFTLKLASFVILLDSSRLFMNLLTSLV